MLLSLEGQCALVTGASSGLGRHFAHTLAAAGADVVVAARRVDRIESLVAEIEPSGRRALAVAMDVVDEASVRAGFAAMADAGMHPGIVVNAAGVSTFKPALEQTVEDWDSVLDTNLKGAFLVSQEAARRMIAAGTGGSIINIGSLLSVRQAGGVAPYAASKAGLLQLSNVLALEWARHSIRVNTICPGYIETDLNRDFLNSDAGDRMRKRIPQRRFGTAQDLDGPLLLLASPSSSYLTGVSIVADGGHQLTSI